MGNGNNAALSTGEAANSVQLTWNGRTKQQLRFHPFPAEAVANSQVRYPAGTRWQHSMCGRENFREIAMQAARYNLGLVRRTRYR